MAIIAGKRTHTKKRNTSEKENMTPWSRTQGTHVSGLACSSSKKRYFSPQSFNTPQSVLCNPNFDSISPSTNFRNSVSTTVPLRGNSSSSKHQKVYQNTRNQAAQTSNIKNIGTRNVKRKSILNSNSQIPPFNLSDVEQEAYNDARKKFYGISKDYLDHGDPTFVCCDCHALLWKKEAEKGSGKNKSSSYSMCCSHGKVQLPKPPVPPDFILRLYKNIHPKSKNFFKHIRAYNMMFAFTSMGGKIDSGINNKGRAPYVFRMSGQNCHLMGSLKPPVGARPKFSQLYIYDTENEVRNRLNAFSNSGRQESSSDDPLDPALISDLKNILDACNPLVISYRMARDRFEEDEQQPVRIKLVAKRSKDGRQYNLPTADEVAGLIVGDIDSSFDERDIIVQTQSGHLQRISELHPSYLALQYPLLFPLAEDGFRKGIKHRGVDDNTKPGRNDLTIREFFSYVIQERCKVTSLMHMSKKLFQQLLVDGYTMIESERLSFIRSQQSKLRLDTYQNLFKNIFEGNTAASDTGQRILLPSSFTGGARYMMQNYLDAMAVVRHFGYPDLFITFTCNPQWPEIIRFLFGKYLRPEDRPELLCRLFKIKLDSMIHDFKEKHVFGELDAVIYTIEFQKRGLPHAHICLFLKPAYKFPTADHVDNVISAELPNKEEYPELFELVCDFMLHGPCGADNPNSPCMDSDKKCTKMFPKDFRDNTSVDDNGYPLYKRRNNGIHIYKGKAKLDNRHVVPYNTFLLKRYQAHINVEWCNQAGAIKYLFKYINKGPDRITAGLYMGNVDTNGQGQDKKIDEIQNYYDCRYISACEAAWRIFGYELHYRNPPVERLAFHLPNAQPVVYDDNADLQDVIQRPSIASSMFTGWMERNSIDSEARKLTYLEFPQHYVWDSSERQWTKRSQRFKLGRIHHISPSAGEAYYLRMLLNKVKGPTTFEDIRTVNGVLCPTFKDACYELGLLDDDKEYIEAIRDANEWAGGKYLRELFVMLLLSNNLSRPNNVWNECRKYLADGILHKHSASIGFQGYTMEPEELDNETLFEIEQMLRSRGSTLKNFPGMPYPSDEYLTATTNRLINEELRYDRNSLKVQHADLLGCLTVEQKSIYDKIIGSVYSNEGGVFFVYGYGGTGKTFLWKTLSSALRCQGKIVLNVASSGIASLLLSGGRTAHSRFVIPINVTEDSFCSITKNSPLAELLCKASMIIWDEAPMIHKHCFEALDRTLRDILRSISPDSEERVFGGKVVVFGGDFRQILPVIPKGSRQDIVNASLNSSYLWSHIQVLNLTVNMRLQSGSSSNSDDVEEMREFADWLLEVGNGTLGGGNDGEAEISIPDEFLITEGDDPVLSIINYIYPDVVSNLDEPSYLQDRAILAPTHDEVNKVNERLLEMVPGDEVVYLSSDWTDKSDNLSESESGFGSPEFLNSLKFSGIPNHRLSLKVGVPIMLLRNIDQPNGLCNGTRLTVIELKKSLIKCRVITGTNIGFETLIPRMKLEPSDKTLPFKFTRKQFPIALCFAMTINKSQGQSLSQVGLFLPRPVFTHGQLYVAFSRVKNKKGLKVLICDKDMKIGTTTKNVVYKEALQSL